MSLEWNLGTSRIEFIGELVNKVRVSHYTVEKKKTVEALRVYRNLLKELYFELDMYVDEWGEYVPEDLDEDEKNISEVFSKTAEELQDRRESEQLNEATTEVFRTLELVDRAVNNARKGEGLDIPQKVEEDPENAGVQGLQ